MPSVFESLGLPPRPLVLAPLAGVSDYPFRLLNQQLGADLTYVEMLSATALLHDSHRTLSMLRRHPDETCVGVQITGRTPEETARAIEKLNQHPFDTIDINMGCPVRKVVKQGCGSAILKDPELVYKAVKLAVAATDKPISAKIRLGWDHDQSFFMENTEAIERAGAAWLTVHGRHRSDDYGTPVNVEAIRQIVDARSIPVIGNGNVFTYDDARLFYEAAGVASVMISRGALGNPWIFKDLVTAGQNPVPQIDQWHQLVKSHLMLHNEAHKERPQLYVTMRKHLLWYVKGWPDSRLIKDNINKSESLQDLMDMVDGFHDHLTRQYGCITRKFSVKGLNHRFQWDPKFDMDRGMDRGVGDDMLA